jgi:uncharacterized membrane protein YbhN (UPF0104 family)
MQKREVAEPAAPTNKVGGLVLRVVALGLAVALFAWTLRDLETDKLGSLLTSVGPLAVLILLPQAVGILLHTAAWRELLAGLGHRAPLFALASTFLGSEGARMVAPAGPAVGESVAAFELKRRYDVPWSRALASLASKKAWVLCTHAVMLVLLLAVGQVGLKRLEAAMPRGELLPWFGVGMTLCLAVAGTLTLALLSSRRVARRVTAMLANVRFARIRAWAVAERDRPEAVAAASMPWSRHALAGIFLLGQWLTEIVETWLVLRLLGVQVSFAEAMLIELGGSLVRSLAFLVPGGLGVQDASYVGILAALGVPGATEIGATFVLLKRAKDLAFIALGLGVLTVSKRGARERAIATVTP